MRDGFSREGLADMWTPVALAREVGRAPQGLTVAGERIVLFRDGRGGLAALKDQCPHRGVKLSLGKVGEDGCLECPFHGWRFAASGACEHVPLNALPEAKRRHLGATAYPVRERGGLIWLHTRPGTEAPDEPHVPEALEKSKVHVWLYAETWNTHWTRAMENMLDSPHLPFVHRRTIGGALRRRMKPDSRMNVEVEPTPTGFRTRTSMDEVPPEGSLDWLRPNGMQLNIPIPGRLMQLNMWCVSVDAQHTRMILVSARDFVRMQPLAGLVDRYNKRILGEDRALVESSHPAEAPPPAEERSVATDRATLAFRRWYHERQRQAAAAGPADEAPRELPEPTPLTG